MAHILAVDDDHDLCTLLKTALERDGHTVETRTSGTQLTDTLCRWADCILLDVMMPGE
ncbi:MAG: response regulator, partial [Gemmiger formicilis]|nr:response regulator [Gemmiger formicilis]